MIKICWSTSEEKEVEKIEEVNKGDFEEKDPESSAPCDGNLVEDSTFVADKEPEPQQLQPEKNQKKPGKEKKKKKPPVKKNIESKPPPQASDESIIVFQPPNPSERRPLKGILKNYKK